MKFRFFLMLFFALSQLINAQKPLDKVEPMFWWKGMKNPHLQILLYGKNIAHHQVALTQGVTIEKLQKVENPNYLFITIDTRQVAASSFDIVVKDEAKTLATYTYELKDRKPGSAQRSSFSTSDVIYLLMPDRFANGNPQNDNTADTAEKENRKDLNSRHGGDIQGIIDHLDYLQDLGITAIWSTPLLEDNEPTFSYHGYAQSNYYRIDPRFGTNADYKRLAEELHQRGMKLIMDYVTNHWGSKSWFIQDLPAEDWIHYWKNGKEGFKRSNYRLVSQTDPYAAQVDADGSEAGWFDTTMPDMNQSNPLVINYMVQNMIWWIEYAGLDGVRVDTYPYNDKKGIAEWTRRVMAEYPNFNIVGEAWLHDQAQISFWQKDSPIAAIEGYNTHLPSVMDFTLLDAITAGLREKAGWNTGMLRIYKNFAQDFLYKNPENLLVFMENHDTPRFNQIYPNLKDYQLALSLILTVRGIPQLYYGSEIGMKGEKSKGDGDIRRDFPGGWPGDTQNAFKDRGRTAQQKAYFNFTKKLLNWRKNNAVIHHGKTLHYVPENNVYVYFRYLKGDRVMVVLNNQTQAQQLDLERYRQGLQDFTRGKEVISGKMLSLQGKLNIPAKTAYIIELEK